MVLRIDPEYFSLTLVNASAGDKKTRTARQWAVQEGLVAAINTSMFQKDYLTSTHRMVSRHHKNNPRKPRENAILVFDPKDDSVPPVQIIDRECQDFDTVGAKYYAHVESIRMFSCKGKNVWAKQPEKWSHAAVGIDHDGRVLLIHARSPFRTHDFVEILRKLPIGLSRLQYAEGGPMAQLYVNAGGKEIELFGSFETGFFEDDGNLVSWPVPNVLGVVRK